MNAVLPNSEPPLQQVITELFRDYKGDEFGGIHAIRGFNFQVWQAVLEALREHSSGNDYAVVLEWQQDVAVLNSSKTPNQVKFIQLKKNESTGTWKLKGLLAPQGASTEDEVGEAPPAQATESQPTGKKPKKRTPKPKRSILAKLYEHRRRFKDCVRARLEFVSDARFEVPDGLGGDQIHHLIEISALPATVLVDVDGKMRAQLEIPSEEALNLSDFALRVTDCPVNEPHKFLAGELAEMQMTSELNLSGAATMRAVLIIASYVNLRAGKSRFAKNFDELLGRAVTRTDIESYLTAANESTVSTESLVEEIINRLNLEVAPFSLVSKMRRELTRACVQITNRSSTAPVCAAHLKDLFDRNCEQYESSGKLTDFLDAWHRDFEGLSIYDPVVHKREYLYCLMAMIIQNANPTKQLPPVSTDQKSEEGQ